MQNPTHLRHPDLKEMKKIFDEADGLIKMVTIAPELPGGIELIDFLKKEALLLQLPTPMQLMKRRKMPLKKAHRI